MMRFTDPVAVYVCARPVDFHKGMGSLGVLVESHLELNPFAEALFVFTNRRATAIKILYWERNSFCLYPKIKGRNAWRKTASSCQNRPRINTHCHIRDMFFICGKHRELLQTSGQIIGGITNSAAIKW
jgi:hypothetical protein